MDLHWVGAENTRAAGRIPLIVLVLGGSFLHLDLEGETLSESTQRTEEKVTSLVGDTDETSDL